ncbi:Transglycosylase-like domain protein [Ophiocordyceps camponoti-floridani]|uniref:Transglycosylase-like domain protein n=1 Tax=Ophiocordyceps camponoti-floridani TaxID=2030778 RepID=A0A8H4QDM9_9HYPO|nr:Transglycosylase-like domain protein [Ophiocordyceps camponoti-floridani]
MQVTLLLSVALSLASARPYPAGPETALRDLVKRELEARKVVEGDASGITDQNLRDIDEIIKARTGKSLFDEDVEVTISDLDKLPAEEEDAILEVFTHQVQVQDDNRVDNKKPSEETKVAAQDPPSDPEPKPKPEPEPEPEPKPAPPASTPPNRKNRPAEQGPSPETRPSNRDDGIPGDPKPGKTFPKFGRTDMSNYMDVVNYWRGAMGLSKLSRSSALEKEALAACMQSTPLNLQHTQGLGAQVLAPGKPDSFEYVFVGGWLCERNTLPGIGAACQLISKGIPGETGWDYQGQTGHADILTDRTITEIGCNHANGVWGCNMT